MARICIIRQGHFPLDARLSREVAALTRAGHDVDLICAKWPDQPYTERGDHLAVYRLPIARRRGGPLRYVFEYGAFQIAATLLVGALHLRRRYDLVQVNTLPDSLVFAPVVPRLFGAPILLDLYEAMPEFFGMKYALSPDHPLVRVLGSVEQSAIRFADQVITCTDQMRERFVERGARSEKIDVILLSADEEKFDPARFSPSVGSADRFVLISHGTIEESFGLDTVVRAVALLKDELPGLRLEIYGDGTFRPTIESLVAELGLEERVRLSRGWVPQPDLIAAIAAADAGVVATKRNALRELTHSTKMFDFISMRKPAIVARTRAVEAYFDDSCLQFFDSTDPNDLARAIRELHAEPELRERMARRASEVSEPYRWVHQRKRYLDIVGRLVAARVGRPQTVVAEAAQDS